MSETYRAIRAGLEEAIGHAGGEDENAVVHRPAAIVRRRTGLSQDRFADALGVAVEVVRGWEAGDEAPSGPAERLLGLIADDPAVIGKLTPEAA